MSGSGFGCLSNDSSLRLDGHKVDTEDPNLFLRLLREQHSDVWAEAFERQLVVCIPQSVSLRHRVRREDIENHVLRASQFGGGDYTTLNGKRVGLVQKGRVERHSKTETIALQ